VLLLVDLDGVVYRASQSVPGVPEALAARVAAGDDVVYVTNNAMHYHSEYIPRLEGHGAPVGPDRVVSSARASALYVRDEMPQVRRVLAVGASGLDRELREAGLEVVAAAHAATRMSQEGIDGWEAAGHPDAVVVGLDPQMTYLRIAAAADCVRAGAVLVATNRDPIYPTERGFRPGAGSIVAAVEVASRTRAHVTIGKPEPYLLVAAARLVGGDVRRAVMIGDALTDVAAGHAVGARTVLMLTGVTTRAMAEQLPESERPTRIAEDGEELGRVLAELAAEA
jgi:glycerol 3-phosphatase-2